MTMARPRRVRSWRDVVAAVMGFLRVRPSVADRSVAADSGEIAAEWRWAAHNVANRRRGCPCGKPAQVARRHPEVIGTVPFLWWTCEDHESASGFVGTMAIYDHPAPCPYGEVMRSAGPGGESPTVYGCPHRTHEETR